MILGPNTNEDRTIHTEADVKMNLFYSHPSSSVCVCVGEMVVVVGGGVSHRALCAVLCGSWGTSLEQMEKVSGVLVMSQPNTLETLARI